jgi:mycothiol synthase
MGEDDIAAVARLLHAAAKADQHAALGEHNWLDLVHGGRAGFAGFVAREAHHEQVIGYAQLTRGHGSWAIESVVHPAHRDPGEHVGIDLVRAALAEVGREGGGHVHVWVPKPTPEDDEIAAAAGLSRGRDLYQMRRPLPVRDAHSTVPTRPFRPGLDEAAWLEVNNRAFLEHPEQGAWDLATLAQREQESWFDAKGFLLYEEGGRLAASCWTKVHDDPPLGEIYVISVDPDFQGRGLGRELVLAGLEHIAAEGLQTGMLYVDSANAAAVGLYRKLGFEIDHIDRAYVGDVRPEVTSGS